MFIYFIIYNMKDLLNKAKKINIDEGQQHHLIERRDP